jgi:predicted nucleic acid-binding protein
VTEVVLDASVVLQWFTAGAEGGAARVRDRFESGRLRVVVPRLLFLEIVNVTARRWGWSHQALLDLAAGLESLGFEVAEPPLAAVAAWTARGLTAYDAEYVALAEERGTALLTDDTVILGLALEIARRPDRFADS